MDIARRNALLVAAACTVFGRTSAEAADGPKRVLVVGDSQAQGLAGGLQRQLLRDRTWRVIDQSHISTGLYSTARFDWPASASGIADKERGAVAVVMFGANDRPPVRSNGTIDPRRAEAFAIGYCAHIRAVASGLKQACPEVVWVGHPVVRDPVYAEDMAFLNQLYESEAIACGARWFSSWPLFVDKAGLYSAHGKSVGGQTERLRADDGVHLTGAGYDVLASALLPDLRFALAGPLNPPT
ncbi:MAG: DUF459 domain-containing protein [Rhodospirillales bacterium]